MGRHPEYPERTLSKSEVEDEGVSKDIFPFSGRRGGRDQYSVFTVFGRRKAQLFDVAISCYPGDCFQ